MMTSLVPLPDRPTALRRRAVFLGRDGAINADRPEGVARWEEFRFLPRVFEAMRRLATLDVDVILVNHQPKMGQRLLSVEAIYELHRQMAAEIERHGGRVDAIYVCPHGPNQVCGCRLPQPGLLMLAAEDRGLSLGQSYMVTGRWDDALAGQSAGCRTVLLTAEPPPANEAWPQGLHGAPDLYQAVLDVEAEIRHPDDKPRENLPCFGEQPATESLEL